jgi:Transposase DDE domain
MPTEPSPAQTVQRKSRRRPIEETQLRNFLERLFGNDLHAKRVLSLTQAALGVLHAASLSIHAIGQGLAAAQNLNSKHAVKQVDRLLSNAGIDVWNLFQFWVPYLIGPRTEIVAALDWTEFDADGHATIALHLVTSHGRATPLLWMTVLKSEMKDRRNEYEDRLLVRLREVLPPGVQVLILADRGFGDQKLFHFMQELGFHYLIRFRGNTYVTSPNGERKEAADWISPSGRAVTMHGAKVTADACRVETVVCVQDKKMKEPWCLASDLKLTGAVAVKRYGRRFSIEESFRDIKDARFGMGLSATHIKDAERRDRLILIATLAISLLTLLGAAGESLGMDRLLKVNTVKRRVLSLLRQGLFWYSAIPAMSDDRLQPLMTRFGELVEGQQVFRELFGLL